MIRYKDQRTGKIIITTEDPPTSKGKRPGPEVISTHNIEEIRAKRKAEAAAAKKSSPAEEKQKGE